MLVYQEGTDDKAEELGDDSLLPHLNEGDEVTLNDLVCNQHFTEPPPRYSEATLIKVLEEYGFALKQVRTSGIINLKTFPTGQ